MSSPRQDFIEATRKVLAVTGTINFSVAQVINAAVLAQVEAWSDAYGDDASCRAALRKECGL